jgi:hypothetical protein
MITERLTIHVAPGRENDFEGALSEAGQVVFMAEGSAASRWTAASTRRRRTWCRSSGRPRRSRPGFSQSELFTRWATLIDPFVVGTPVVERFELCPALSL